jgi:glutathione S-transferase
MTIDFTGKVKLYGSGTSPFVRKVRVALLELNIDHEFQADAPWSAQSKTDELNPLKKVPVLELAEGQILFESKLIIQYIDLRCNGALLPTNPSERIIALQTEALADGIGEAGGLLTQESWRAPQARSQFWMDRQLEKINHGIDALERSFDQWNSPAHSGVQLAPIAVRSLLGYIAFWQPQIDWASRSPKLVELARQLDTKPAWIATKPQLPAGASFPKL